jgi:hypothetical protein
LAVVELLQRLGYEYDARFTWIGAALVALGILLVAWASCPDRWRRRGRAAHLCPRCKYDLRGIAVKTAADLKCAECGLQIKAEQLLAKLPRTRRLVAIALLIFVAAHVTALWPQVQRRGWKRLIPSTALVLQPMDVGEWTDVQLRQGKSAGVPLTRQKELARRLLYQELWSWQEWILLKRVAQACRGRDNYGITPEQYDMAVRLYTTPANAWEEETVAQRLARLGDAADVPLLTDWERLNDEGLFEDLLASPAETNASVARALEQLLEGDTWATFGCWDITPEGVVMTGWQKDVTTSRLRIYDVSDLTRDADDCFALIDLIQETATPANWIVQGGTVNAAFAVSDHLVVVATTRAHFQIENILDNLRDANAAEPPFIAPHEPVTNPRGFALRSEVGPALLDHLRFLRTIPIETLRSAGPTFGDGVTEEELEACGRDAFGMLDRIRESSSSPPQQARAE